MTQIVDFFTSVLSGWSNSWRKDLIEDSAWICSITFTLLPLETNCETSVDTVEEEASSHLGCFVFELVWNIDSRPQAVKKLFIRTWYDLLLYQYLVDIQINQFSIHYFHQQKRNLLSCFHAYNYISSYISAWSVIVCYHQDCITKYRIVERCHIFISDIFLLNYFIMINHAIISL